MIAAVGLTDFFEYLVIGNECERPKPFPDPYLKALKHFKVSAENAFAFEVRSITLKFSFLFLSTRRHWLALLVQLQDSPSGLGAAVAAGLAVIGITTGNPGPVLVAAGAAFLIKDYDDPALWSKLEKEAVVDSQ
jgi:beta-phosphoglucomutase-like phosphatase (HAD superfamily)